MRVSTRNRHWPYRKDYLAQRMIDEHLKWLETPKQRPDLSDYPLMLFADRLERQKRKRR